MTLQEKKEIKRLVKALLEPGPFFVWVDEIKAKNEGYYSLQAWKEAERELLDHLGVNKYRSWESYRIARLTYQKKVNRVI